MVVLSVDWMTRIFLGLGLIFLGIIMIAKVGTFQGLIPIFVIVLLLAGLIMEVLGSMIKKD